MSEDLLSENKRLRAMVAAGCSGMDAQRAEILRLRAIESAAKEYQALYLALPVPRDYEAAWGLTLLEAILAGRGPEAKP